jgi:hypothetical protein
MQSPMHHAIQYGVAGKSSTLQKEQRRDCHDSSGMESLGAVAVTRQESRCQQRAGK